MPKTCSQCQNVAPDEAVACPNCGAALAGDPPAGAPPGAPVGATPGAGTTSSLPPFRFDASRLTQADRITGIASLVLIIALFLPWFSISGTYATVSVSVSWDGTTAHGYLWLVFVIALAVVAYLVAKAGWGKLPFDLPAPESLVIMTATVVNVVLVLIAFLLKPGGDLYSGVGWTFGSFVALAAAVVAAAPTAIPAIQRRRGASGQTPGTPA
jgi:hypothetical protein